MRLVGSPGKPERAALLAYYVGLLSFLTSEGICLRDNGMSNTFATVSEGDGCVHRIKFADCASWFVTKHSKPASDSNWSSIWGAWQEFVEPSDFQCIRALMTQPFERRIRELATAAGPYADRLMEQIQM